MGDHRKSHLNGAYYVPSAPPLPKTNHNPVRHPGVGGCNPLSCCQIIFTIFFILGLMIFICWLIFRPNTVKFHATNASLTEFTLDNNTLHYNLALNLTIRNPNKHISIFYDRIEARAFYEGERFASAELTPFYQGHKSTDSLTAEFKGQNQVLLEKEEISNYNKEKNSGIYEIEVKLYLQIRLKFEFVKSKQMKPEIECDLEIPLNNGTSSGNYESKRCEIDW